MVLVFNKGMRQVLKDHLEHRDYSEEAKILAKPSRVIRQGIFNFVASSFTGNFNSKCQKDAVPLKIKRLVSMILYGDNIKKTLRIKIHKLLLQSLNFYFHTAKKQKLRYNNKRQAVTVRKLQFKYFWVLKFIL